MNEFKAGSRVEVQNVGVQRVVADHGDKVQVENENGAIALVPRAWCTPVDQPAAAPKKPAARKPAAKKPASKRG